MCTLGIELGKEAEEWLEEGGEEIRKGMILVDPSTNPVSSWCFEAEVWTIDHSETVINGKF